MAIGDASWMQKLQTAIARLGGAKSRLGDDKYGNKDLIKTHISAYESEISRRLSFLAEKGEPGQLDEWAEENPDTAAEFGAGDGRTQPKDETYIASSDGPGGISSNADKDFSFDAPSTYNPFGPGDSEGEQTSPTDSLGELEKETPLMKWQEGAGSRRGVRGNVRSGMGGNGSASTEGSRQQGSSGSTPYSPGGQNGSGGGVVATDTSGPVDDNLSADPTDPRVLEQSLTGSAAKDYLGDIAGGDIDTSELEKRIRTQQFSGGLGYGGASAKQEAKIVGRYKQGERLRASEQLASLSEAESQTTTQIGQLLGQTQSSAMGAASAQLTVPTGAYESILGGSMSGLNSIFGLGGLL